MQESEVFQYGNSSNTAFAYGKRIIHMGNGMDMHKAYRVGTRSKLKAAKTHGA